MTPLTKERKMNMKKIVLTVVAVMSMTMAFAAGENDNNTATTNAYKFNLSTYALSRALNLNQDQVDVVEDINRTFSAEMMNAAVSDSSERAAIKKDLSYMHYVLNNSQYREYVKLLNVTLNNRGLNK